MKTALQTIILFLVFPFLCFGWSGECVGVSDGDSITVMHEGMAEKIRLYGIDCPEKKQDVGSRAKQFTSVMVYRQVVDVEPVTQDRYGRTVAWVSEVLLSIGNFCGQV
jgi:endonuclease YncB( thermonuclease family)